MRQDAPRRCTLTNAFSLVELSIVLVILGLLVGGILTGRSLIRASEIRSVLTEREKYFIAVTAFRDKYFYMPGDLPNATQFWGAKGLPANGAACNGVKNLFSTASPTTCDGDGNGKIEVRADMYEHLKLWQHLSNSGLIPSYPYMGALDAMAVTCANDLGGDFPNDCPPARIGGGRQYHYWMIYYTDVAPTFGPF